MKMGDKIYFTGDMANVPDFGFITGVIEPSKFNGLSYTIALNDGRIFRMVSELSFVKGVGQRFKTMEQYREEQRVAMEKLRQFAAKVA